MALIHWIEREGPGRLGVMARPGRHSKLEDDLQKVSEEGVDVLVSLLTDDDIREFGLEEERVIAHRLDLDFKSFPIPDKSVPNADSGTHDFLQARLDDLEQGNTVVLHCSSGRGRTGLMAGSLLVMEGLDPDHALSRVRGHRLTTIPDTKEQAQWVRDLSARLGRPVQPPKSNGRLLWAAGFVVALVAAVYVSRQVLQDES